jgi:hypothetical protein
VWVTNPPLLCLAARQDVNSEPARWPVRGPGTLDGAICINMLHIAPAQCCRGIMRWEKKRSHPRTGHHTTWPELRIKGQYPNIGYFYPERQVLWWCGRVTVNAGLVGGRSEVPSCCRGCGYALKPGAPLIIYGPFKVRRESVALFLSLGFLACRSHGE